MAKGISAKWIIAQDGNLYEDCTLIIDEGKVQGIVKSDNLPQELLENDRKNVKDYGNSVITPGFINLHNHLQYSDVKAKQKGLKYALKHLYTDFKKHYFIAGIKKTSFVFRLADLLNKYFCLSHENKLASFKLGLQESLKCGTTCVVQLSKESKYFEVLNDVPIKTYLFFELFSDSTETSKEEFRTIQKKIDKLVKQKSEDTFIGVAPHSICSVHKRLFKILVKYCKKNNILMTIRVSESQDEIDWAKHGFSDIDVLNEFTGQKKFDPIFKGVSPVQYLEQLDVLNKRLIASYGNFLDDNDLEILKENKVSLAYCPRVSENLHHKMLDFDKVLEYFPERFGFGTNSLSFNKDLSLLNELRFVNKGRLDVIEAIKYLTIVPAKILRLDNTIGSLEKGKDADFNVFKLQENEDYKALLDKERPDDVYIKGHRKIRHGELN